MTLENIVKLDSKKKLIIILTKEAKIEGLELEEKFIEDSLTTYEKTMILIETLAVITLLRSFDKKMASSIVNSKVAGLTFKERLIKKNMRLVDPIINKINEGKRLGKSNDEIALTIKPIIEMSDRHTKMIEQTEKHRIIEATKDVAYTHASRETSFDIYWNSRMDRKVRQQHMELEGQKRSEEGYFEVDGHKAKYPSGFGKAYLDVRCRCSTYIMLK
ncbi:MAG: phage minor head protein [Cetobacterium sp.]